MATLLLLEAMTSSQLPDIRSLGHRKSSWTSDEGPLGSCIESQHALFLLISIRSNNEQAVASTDQVPAAA